MATQPVAPRLSGLPSVSAAGRRVPVAASIRARLLGLARLDRDEAGPGLWIPSCASVHTFGMRFSLDLVFFDRDGRPCAVRRGVPPRRFVSCRRARAVLELPSAEHRPAGIDDLALCGSGLPVPGGEFSQLST